MLNVHLFHTAIFHLLKYNVTQYLHFPSPPALSHSAWLLPNQFFYSSLAQLSLLNEMLPLQSNNHLTHVSGILSFPSNCCFSLPEKESLGGSESLNRKGNLNSFQLSPLAFCRGHAMHNVSITLKFSVGWRTMLTFQAGNLGSIVRDSSYKVSSSMMRLLSSKYWVTWK